MSQRANSPRLDPDAVGQDPTPDAERPTATGGWFRVAALIWIVPILLAVIFAAVMLFVAN